MEKSKEEVLAKRIKSFPSYGSMTDENIKRNVYSAMEEYASPLKQEIELLKKQLEEKDYWKQRCEAAEEVIIYLKKADKDRTEMIKYATAYDNWQQFKGPGTCVM